MSKIAVIKVNNSQYMVEEGQEYEIVRIKGKEGDKVAVKEVLLTIDGDKVLVGTPFIDKAVVDFEILAQAKANKVRTFTYKAKARFRKTKGMRILSTKIKISKIS